MAAGWLFERMMEMRQFILYGLIGEMGFVYLLRQLWKTKSSDYEII